MRDARLDYIRLLGNLAICGVHAYPFMYAAGRNAEFWFWSFFSMNFCMMAMPTFFLVSGYLLFQNYSLVNYANKMRSRIKRLWVPLIIWNIVACLFTLALGVVNAKVRSNAIELELYSWIGWLKQVAAYGAIANGVLWYLRAVLVFAFVSPILWLLYRYCHWWIVVVLSSASVALWPNLTRSDFPMYGLALFTLGGLAAYRQFNVVDFVERHARVFLSLSVLSVVVACCFNFCHNDVFGPTPLLRFFGAPLFVVMGISLSKWIDEWVVVRRIVAWFVPAGFMIYVGHGMVLACCMHALGGLLPYGVGKMSVITLATMAFTIFFWTFIWHTLNRLCHKFLAVIDGRWR